MSDICFGADPSLTNFGWSDGTIHEAFRTHPPATTKQRADEIMQQIEDRILAVRKGHVLLAVEGPIFFATDATAIFDVGYLHARLDLLAAKWGCTLMIVQPTQLKRFVCGKGNAPKTEVALEILQRWGVRFTDDRGADKAHAYALWRYGMAVLTGEIVHNAPAARGSKKKPLKKIKFEELGAEDLDAIAAGRVNHPIVRPKREPLTDIPKTWVARARRIRKIEAA